MKGLVPGNLIPRKNKKGEIVKDVWIIRIELPRKPNGKRNLKHHTFHGSKKEAEVELQRKRFEYSDMQRCSLFLTYPQR